MKHVIFSLVIVCLLALAVPGATWAQGETPTLRSLAERRKFAVGTAISSWTLKSTPDLRAIITAHFNQITPENDAKMCFVQPQENQFDFRGLDAVVSLAESARMKIHGHTLLWHQCFPDWLNGRELSRDAAIQILRDHIKTVVGRYRGRFALWDVVNEAVESDGSLRQTPWLKWIGADYIELAFRFAHEADPDALLFYNDYGVEAINAKSDGVYKLLSDFVKRGVPLHGFGMQMHIRMNDVGPGRAIEPAKLAENMERFGKLGLQVQITEMDVLHAGEYDEAIARQVAGTYYQTLQTCLKVAACTGLTVWGVHDAMSWLRMPQYSNNPKAAPLLFDDKLKPKLAYTALMDVLARALGDKPILTDDAAKELVEPQATVKKAALPDPKKSNVAQLAPDSVNGLAYYAAFPVKISVDGDASDWANIPRDTLKTIIKRPDGDSTALTFAAAADDKNFYFLGEAQDSKVVSGLHPIDSQWYEEDSVEFYINGTGDRKLAAYKPGIAQLAIPAANIGRSGAPLIAGYNSKDVTLQAVVKKTDKGYLVEASVPLKTNVWSIEPKQGLEIGFQVHLNGSSDKQRDTKLIWSLADTQDQSYRDPSLFGVLIFWDVNQK